MAVIWGASTAAPLDDPNREIVKATWTSGDSFSIVRAQESTSASAWSTGSKFAHIITAGTLSEIETTVNAKADPITANGILKGDGAGVVSAASAGTDYLTPTGNGSQLTGLYAPPPASTTAPATPTDGQLWIDTNTNSITSFIPYTVTNLTNWTTSDYQLKAGEVVYKTFNTTSLPLSIATVEGLYEIHVIGDLTISLGTANPTKLNPNNTTYTAGIIDMSEMSNSVTTTDAGGVLVPTGWKDGVTSTAFDIFYQHAITTHTIISTFTKAKTLRTNGVRRDTATTYINFQRTFVWTDTTTAWTSLGTIVFPYTQAGTIVIKRII
jgi:hypothetical protein